MTVAWVKVSSVIGTETRSVKQRAFKTDGSRNAYLVKRQARFVRLNTYVDIGPDGSDPITPTDNPTITVEFGASVPAFDADYSRVTGKLVRRKTVRSFASAWHDVGSEVVVEEDGSGT